MMRAITVWIGAVMIAGGLWGVSLISQGLADEPAAPSSASEGTGGAAGTETAGSDAVPPVVEGAPATPAEAGEVQERTVSLTQAVHFTDAEGQDVVVGPGSYRVDAEGTNRIRLFPAETGKAVVIDAVSFTHQQLVESPVPLTVPDPQQPDVLHLALLSPGGTGLDAIGTYSGVKPRQVMDMLVFANALNLQYRVMAAPATGTLALPGEFAIQTISGNFLTAVSGGGRTTDVIHSDARRAQAWEKFRLSVTYPNTPHDKSMQTTSGNYLTAVSGGGRTTDVLHTDATQARDWERFRLIRAGVVVDRLTHYPYFAIQTIKGFYVTAVGGGGRTTDAIHTDATQLQAWEQFRIVKCGDVGSGYAYHIKAANGEYLIPVDSSGLVGSIRLDNLGAYERKSLRFYRQGDGSYALQTSFNLYYSLKYVTALGGGGQVQKYISGTQRSRIFHTVATQVQAWEKFRVIDRGNCTYAIQTASGFYVGIYKDSGGHWLLTTRRDGVSTANEVFELIPWDLESPLVLR
jgi:hypothetical protein